MSDDQIRRSPWEELARSPRVWLGLAIAVLAIAFITQNRDPVTINLLFLKMTMPQWVTLLIIFLAGGATGFLLRSRR